MKYINTLLWPLYKNRLPKITNTLLSQPKIFKAPKLTADLIRAIRLISPHCALLENEQSRQYWEADQNASCWGEDEVVSKYFTHYPKPKKILEIGPGLGRSVVFLTKQYNLNTSMFDLFEADGTQTKYTLNGPKFRDSFCGSIEELKTILSYNQVQNYSILNASKYQHDIQHISQTYDLIYSFYAIGFHWDIHFFLKDIVRLMRPHAVAFFIVHDEFRLSKELKKLHHATFRFTATQPENTKHTMLVLSKKPLALI